MQDVPPLPRSVPEPAIELTATCLPPVALDALRAALAAEGFRPRPTTDPRRVEGCRTSWADLLSLAPPARTVVAGTVSPTTAGCTVRIDHPTWALGSPRDRSTRVVARTVERLRTTGVGVTVGTWTDGRSPR